MNKTKTTNLIVVDASGSMQSKKEEVIGGLKQLFSDIKKDAQKDVERVNVTTIVVDFSSPDDINVIAYEKDSTKLDESLAENYKVRGWTALYDAVGLGFALIPKDSDSVFINILTDGEENSSKKYKQTDVKELFQKADAKNWAVTFMGTTKEAVENAKNLGVKGGNSFMFRDSKEGVNEGFASMSKARSSYYAMNSKLSASNTVNMDNLMKDEDKD